MTTLQLLALILVPGIVAGAASWLSYRIGYLDGQAAKEKLK